jgi:hypothetical protein
VTAYLHDPATGDPYNAETFDIDAYLGRLDPEWLTTPEGRRELTRDDPLLWSCVYVPELLRNADGEITFSDIHLGIYRDAISLTRPPGHEGSRVAYVAPRGSGKSTTLFVVTTLWLACHHPQFVAAFSSSARQAIDHLHAVRGILAGSRLVRTDYPAACTPALKANGMAVADSDAMVYMQNGFVIAARGIDTEVLGLTDPLNRRPSAIWLDDCEGAEGSGYSLYLAGQRLRTVVDGILPMNDRAHVRMVGTVTILGGIMHDLVSTVITNDKPAQWITDERFTVTYFPAIVARPDGSERSCWPGKWPMSYLDSIRDTRSFAKNFNNQPLGADGGYWTQDDIAYGTIPTLTRRILAIDPATTTKRSSDRTGLAVVAYSPAEDRCVVEYATGVHLTGRRLADYIRKLIVNYPHRVAAILLEVNAGGELWGDILEDVPAKVVTHTASVSKEVRFAEVLDWYQKSPTRVLHAERFPMLEAEMTGFPKGANDDVLDACAAGIAWFMRPQRRVAAGVRRGAYT